MVSSGMFTAPSTWPDANSSAERTSRMNTRPRNATALSSIGSMHVDSLDCTTDVGARRSVSVMRKTTTRPETNVSAATTHMAAGNPNASAVTPASSAPTA
jgi:hypothetical protein